MGCAPSGPKEAPKCKLLLQGTAGCGKTTFSKQMKIIHGQEFSGDERTYFKSTMSVNVLLGLKDLAEYVREHSEEDAKEHIKFLDGADAYNFAWNKKATKMVKEIYNSDPFKEAREHHKSEFKEGLQYAIQHVENFLDAEWLPSNTDILYARGRTSGSLETKFTTGGYDFTLVDVGGQVQERRKWAAQHNDLNGILFFAATDEYDVPSDEAEDKTKMEVSLSVWEDTIHNEAIAGKVAIILFLNKCDLLEDRLKQSPKSLKKVYKKYNGGSDVSKALDFMQQLYISRIREGSAVTNSQIYVHQTCALDTGQMQVVFQSVRDFVVTQRMQRANLI